MDARYIITSDDELVIVDTSNKGIIFGPASCYVDATEGDFLWGVYLRKYSKMDLNPVQIKDNLFNRLYELIYEKSSQLIKNGKETIHAKKINLLEKQLIKNLKENRADLRKFEDS